MSPSAARFTSGACAPSVARRCTSGGGALRRLPRDPSRRTSGTGRAHRRHGGMPMPCWMLLALLGAAPAATSAPFSLSIDEPSEVDVDADQTATFVVRTHGSGQQLHLRFQDIPGPLRVAAVYLASPTVRAGETSVLTIRPHRQTPTGEYQFYVIAEDDAHATARAQGFVAVDNGIFGCPSGWRQEGDLCQPIPLGS